MPPTVMRSYCHEVFGWTGADGTYCEGLVDSRGEEDFHGKLEALRGSCDEREKGVLGMDHDPTFFLWYKREKAQDFCSGTLADQREAAGLGSPPAPYYTNASESMNSALKEKTNYTKMQCVEFNCKTKSSVDQQREEVEKAIVGGGIYELVPVYESLQVKDGKW